MQKLVIIEDYNSLDINQIIEITLRYGIILIVCILAIIIIGLLVDNYRKDSYVVKKYNYRTLDQEIGGGEEYYYRYWVWQRNKKKYLISVLRYDLGIDRKSVV